MMNKNVIIAGLLLAVSIPGYAFSQDALAPPVDSGVAISSGAPESNVTTIDSSSLPPPMTASETIVPPGPNVVVPPAANMPQGQAISGQAVPGIQAPVPELTPEASTTPVEREMAEHLAFVRPNVSISAMPSLFLTLWESDLVADARLGLNIRPQADDVALAPEGETVVSPREVALGGIVYRSKKNWVIWLNNRRVSPDAIPNEIYDLKVFKDHIDLEWFDASTNQVYPIRLRTYQRFNLDSRIFLPG